MYVSYPQTVFRAPKDLKGFRRVSIKAGEKVTVSLILNATDLRYYDDKAKQWADEAGEYQIHVGASSRTDDLLIHPLTVQS
ncbi:fibronectin type III-like domain-contianing protein [Veronia nyctiphanis]|nr:fibronectin type III-like domain-contianing protein [Veronia nyctiphanis]